MTYKLIFTFEAEKDLQDHIKSGDKQRLKKIYALFEELQEHPYTGTGKPERVKYIGSGIWSRRITDKHMLVYSVDEGRIVVLVVSVAGHYGDK
jgi:toxin YoeB